MTWAEYESYQDYRCSVAAKAKSHNEQVRVAENTIHDSIVSGSKGAVPSDMKNIRANRDIEKRRVEAEYLISERLETADLLGSTDHAIIHNASQPAALLSQDFESISTTPHRDKALLSFADFEDDF